MIKEPAKQPNWQRYLKENNLGMRLLITGILLIALTLFIHFREVRVETLEIGSRAKNYVVAQVDFEFPDEEGTAILRQQSARDVGLVYRIDPKALEKRRFQFEHFLIHDQSWRALLPSSTFEELYQGADRVVKDLAKMRFTDSRTLQRLESLKLLTPEYFLTPSAFDGKTTNFPQHLWEKLQASLLKKHLNQGASIAYIVSYFEKTIWPLEKDLKDQRTLQNLVETTVPIKLSKVQAGTRIIDQGEELNERQVMILQSMKKALSENRKLLEPLTLLGSLIFATIIVLVMGSYLRVRHKSIVQSVSKLALYATVVILTLIIAKVTEYFLIHNMSGFFEMISYPLFVPFAAILLCVLLDVEIALVTSCFLTVILGLSLAVDHNRFIAINLLTGVIAVIVSRLIRKRKEVFIACGKVWLSCIPIFFIFNFAQDYFWNIYTLSNALMTFAFLALSAILIAGLLPVFESIFHIMTDITLMEYMDPNNELLRRLSVEAPGTYQHCLVVGSIAEAAANAIGANGLFCRVSTLYHDIGKLFNPHYFTENQMGGFNIHQLLTPQESTQVIISHVTEGEALARKNGLPQSFIDIIREHHGTKIVYYFYAKQVEQMGGGVDQVDESIFRYPGPKPQSKESAIIMMADTVEAASRSVDDINKEKLLALIERLIGEKLKDGQFSECELSFKEFEVVKSTIIQTLSVARHLRIKYPTIK